MKTPQQHAQEILPLVTAQANGEVVQMYVSGEWSDCKEPTAFVDGCKYRVKPKTILVNGFEVPEPMMVKPDDGSACFFPCVSSIELYGLSYFEVPDIDKVLLNRGIYHSTKEAAIAHAKAMLGINPKDGE